MRCMQEFDFYAGNFLKILTKAGLQSNLTLNKSQLYLQSIERRQLKETGKVRLIIPKGRQAGISTYVGAKGYHHVTHNKGQRVHILTHLKDSTDTLFKMVRRFHDSMPDKLRCPTITESAKELVFKDMDSSYSVGTARSESAGRGGTIQFFHGSEVAFWPNAKDNMAGIMQAIPRGDNTHVYLESTGNGVGNVFHRMCMEAASGESEYELAFIPWYWMEEYAEIPKEPMLLDDNEIDIKEIYNLSDAQLNWRRIKIKELGHETLFMQEYPLNVDEAFQAGGDSFMSLSDIVKARKCIEQEQIGVNLLGVDPARFGDDRTVLIRRQGRNIYNPIVKKGLDTMAVAGLVVTEMKLRNYAQVFVDVVGLGAGVYDRLIELGYGDRVTAVNGAERALEDGKYGNKRAELWDRSRLYMTEHPVSLPDSDAIQQDALAPSYKADSKGRLLIQSKEDIKKGGGLSTDIWDAITNTFEDSPATHIWGSQPIAHTAPNIV